MRVTVWRDETLNEEKTFCTPSRNDIYSSRESGSSFVDFPLRNEALRLALKASWSISLFSSLLSIIELRTRRLQRESSHEREIELLAGEMFYDEFEYEREVHYHIIYYFAENRRPLFK